MNKKIGIIIGVIITIIIIIAIAFKFQSNNRNNNQTEENIALNNESSVESEKNIESTHEYTENESSLASLQEINLQDIDGNGTNYLFTYKNESYEATYTVDNWHIVDSYKIINQDDIAIICQALIAIHPIHGKDMSSYRTVEDLVYEWEQHNLAYVLLPEDNPWKKNAKDVDLNPEDQGRSLREMYEVRKNM